LDPDRRRGTRRQLQGGDGTTRPRDPPRAQAMLHGHDPPIAVKEHDIDGEPHKEHVHRRGRVDEHPTARLEATATEQAAHATERALRYLAALADDGVISPTTNARDRNPSHSRACHVTRPSRGRSRAAESRLSRLRGRNHSSPPPVALSLTEGGTTTHAGRAGRR